MLAINVANKNILDRVLRRKRLRAVSPEELDLSDMFKTILRRANEFVPSESGSILLDDPVFDERKRKPGRLYFIACFGRGSAMLTRMHIPITAGIVGRTYRTGKPSISKSVRESPFFQKKIDRGTMFITRSIVCVPIKIRGVPIGALELINRVGKVNFDKKDLILLNIFAGYTSTLVQNSLDAKRFGELSIRDNLTGLFNDRYFFERMRREVRNCVDRRKDLSLVFLDLDRFKEVNDSHGHLAGSQLLREVGWILMGYTETTGMVAIRYGGDEFVVMLPQTGVEKARAFAEELRRKIEDFVFLEKKSRGVPALKIKGVITASMGVASFRKNVRKNTDIHIMRNALIKAADTAMYVSKLQGKNTVTVSEKIFP